MLSDSQALTEAPRRFAASTADVSLTLALEFSGLRPRTIWTIQGPTAEVVRLTKYGVLGACCEPSASAWNYPIGWEIGRAELRVARLDARLEKVRTDVSRRLILESLLASTTQMLQEWRERKLQFERALDAEEQRVQRGGAAFAARAPLNSATIVPFPALRKR